MLRLLQQASDTGHGSHAMIDDDRKTAPGVSKEASDKEGWVI